MFPFTSFNKFHNKKLFMEKNLYLFSIICLLLKKYALFYTVILNINLLLKN